MVVDCPGVCLQVFNVVRALPLCECGGGVTELAPLFPQHCPLSPSLPDLQGAPLVSFLGLPHVLVVWICVSISDLFFSFMTDAHSRGFFLGALVKPLGL